ncbi:Cas10/Cmr2 second palm domain-containing protein [Caldicellulosiruptor acetigenus]|uniref:Cas10/Cmr2 second palm domain-containing protein n=1 Tax=Caldicellulosiruptor acetigenus 6A TaxID=632516 RepID=G2PYR4_9FIRM|nr:hypothetical protein [Caldicellulosiruptor acetigenus]AEM74983.1 hypothetical protein Calla_2457 [Caldicellulosiruptor acetigenus 6A]
MKIVSRENSKPVYSDNEKKSKKYLDQLYPVDGNYISSEELCKLKQLIEEMKDNQTLEELAEKNMSKKETELFDKRFEFSKSLDKNETAYLPALIDAAKIYVLVDFLTSVKESNIEQSTISFSRKDSYLKFLNPDSDDIIKQLLIEVMIETQKENNLSKQDYNQIKEKFKHHDKIMEILEIKIEVVKGGISKIKEYITEADKLAQMRGATELIKEANIERTREIINKAGLIPECLIYGSGGNSFIVVPKNKGQEICEKIEKEYSQLLLGGRFAFEFLEAELGEFLFDYSRLSTKITQKLTTRHIVRLPMLQSTSCQHETPNSVVPQDVKLCTTCWLRDPKKEIKIADEQHWVCDICYSKFAKSKNIRSSYHEEYCKFIGRNISYFKLPESLSEIDDYIALIYGDGNNLGNVIMNIRNVFELMYLSRRLDKITVSAVYEALKNAIEKESEGKENATAEKESKPLLKFEIIILGGEDILMIVPAKWALEVAKQIIEKFDTAFSNTITLSVGILITKSTMPMSAAYDFTVGLLKNAKKYVKKKKLEMGSVDVEVLTGSSILSKKGNKVIFPCEVERLEKILKAFKTIKEKLAKAKIYLFKEAAETLLPEEFELFYVFHKAREENIDAVEKAIQEMLDEDVKFVGGFVKKKDVDGKEQVILPWVEIAKLRDFI